MEFVISTTLESIDLRLESRLIHNMTSNGWVHIKTEKPRILVRTYLFKRII